jgi:hypothetical protein
VAYENTDEYHGVGCVLNTSESGFYFIITTETTPSQGAQWIFYSFAKLKFRFSEENPEPADELSS